MDRYRIWIQETDFGAAVAWRVSETRTGRLVAEGAKPRREWAEAAAAVTVDRLLHPPRQPAPLDLFTEATS